MNSTPKTRASLLIRVRDPADQAAWHEFVEIYRPIILRLAGRRGCKKRMRMMSLNIRSEWHVICLLFIVQSSRNLHTSTGKV